VQDPFSPFEIVCFNEMWSDPAFALSPAEVEAYRKTRDLAAILPKLKEGARPTLFRLERLPASVLPAWEGLGVAMAYARAFSLACHWVVPADGPAMEPDRAKVVPQDKGLAQADDEWFDRVAKKYGIATCYEIGRVAYHLARLPEGARGPFG
jgi:hypothetical protein